MCGISGIYTQTLSDQQIHLIDAIIKNQISRGPDHTGKLIQHNTIGSIVFGHNRLSVIDLSDHANQPMWDPDERYCITYNGEIYNYIEIKETLKKNGMRFLTQSDTEVILNAFAYWGVRAFDYFKGPFAFGLYDKKTGSLLLCRDRFGVRPLYYLKVKNTLYFASSTTVLAKTFQLTPNLHYLARGLQSLVYEDGSEETSYKEMISLPAGCYLQAHIDSHGQLITHTTRYFDLAKNAASLATNLPIQDAKKIVELTHHQLDEAVRIRLRTDVPLGVTLSSGLDSNSIAALMRERIPKLVGFTYGDPTAKQSEGPLVAQCAKFIGLDMQYVWPNTQQMMSGLFETLIAQGAPFSGLGVVAQFLLFKHIRQSGIKVVLGGQGGDEVFMGYRKFMLFWQKQLLRQKKYLKASMNMLQWLPTLLAETMSLRQYWQHRKRYMSHANFQSSLDLPTLNKTFLTMPQENDIIARQIQDITQFSLPTLLRYEDRNAMGNSVEGRLPYLDHELVTLGIALPVAMKIRSGFSKWPIRKIMQDKIPNAVRLAKRKRGFDIPLRALLNGGFGKTIRYALHDRHEFIKDFIKSNDSIDTTFSDHQLLNRRSAIAESIALLWLAGETT